MAMEATIFQQLEVWATWMPHQINGGFQIGDAPDPIEDAEKRCRTMFPGWKHGGFPTCSKYGYPNIIHVKKDFPRNKPSSYGGYPHNFGKLQICPACFGMISPTCRRLMNHVWYQRWFFNVFHVMKNHLWSGKKWCDLQNFEVIVGLIPWLSMTKHPSVARRPVPPESRHCTNWGIQWPLREMMGYPFNWWSNHWVIPKWVFLG